MPGWLVHLLYLSVAAASLIATVVASILMRPEYHWMQLAIVWQLGFINCMWPVGFLLQYRVDRRCNSGYQLAIRDRKTPVIIIVILNIVTISMAIWMLRQPLG
jgi:hypothetical protein